MRWISLSYLPPEVTRASAEFIDEIRRQVERKQMSAEEGAKAIAIVVEKLGPPVEDDSGE